MRLQRVVVVFAMAGISIAIVANALSVTGRMPIPILFGSLSDKVYHVAAFALLAAIAEIPGPAPRSLWALVFLAAGIEVAQLAVPHRLAEMWDFVSSLIGVLLGWAVANLIRRFLFPQQNRSEVSSERDSFRRTNFDDR